MRICGMCVVCLRARLYTNIWKPEIWSLYGRYFWENVYEAIFYESCHIFSNKIWASRKACCFSYLKPLTSFKSILFQWITKSFRVPTYYTYFDTSGLFSIKIKLNFTCNIFFYFIEKNLHICQIERFQCTSGNSQERLFSLIHA